MSVRVVDDVTCSTCGEHGVGFVVKVDIETGMPRHTTCPDCHGTGTVERDVTCGGCRWWRRTGETYSECSELGNGRIRDDFACKAWEPRE